MVKRHGSHEDSDDWGEDSSDKNDLLIENFVGLQHAMTNLSVKFGNLSDNISKLLEIFEEAAKNISKAGGDENEELTKKIDFLLDQNKTIARGLVMMEDRLKTVSPVQSVPMMSSPYRNPPSQTPPQSSRPRPLPRL